MADGLKSIRESEKKIPWRTGFSLLKRFWPFLRPENRLATGMAVLALLAIPSGVISPFLVRMIFDEAIPSHDTRTLINYGLLIAGFTLFTTFVDYIKTLLTIKMHNRVSYRVLRALFAHILRLPLRKVNRTQTGYLMSRVRDDVLALDSLMTDTFVNAGIDFLRAVLFCSLLLFIDAGLAFSGLVLIALILACVMIVSPALRKRSAVVREADARSSASLHEALSGLQTVRTAGREPHEPRRFGLAAKTALRALARRDVLGAITDSTIGLAAGLGGYVIVAVGAYRIMTGQSTVGNLFAFFIFLTQLMGAFASVLALAPNLQKGLASLQRIFDLLDEPEEKESVRMIALPSRLRGEVCFDEVSFSYDGVNQALEDVSLLVRPVEVIALVGRRGAGKSTLVQLLPRLYEIVQARLLMDGVPLRDYPLRWLRRQIGVVPQDVFLFDRSIGENIAYAAP